ncbi:MAG: Holliday junction resolvase RecU [Firmicutes bacterium]|nr:Holliday junction resolvase RecU [Candidatus Fiminaster equi]
MINYANGKNFQKTIKIPAKSSVKPKSFSHGNRGMAFESDINETNEYYKNRGLCLVTKRPTPINVVEVDYSRGAIIKNAYFEKQSTTDYNGVYNGRYLDFEAKSTRKKTSFPLANISRHQIEHLKNVIKHKGIAFFIIEFSTFDEVYYLNAQYVINYYEKGERKSIPYDAVKEHGKRIKKAYIPRLDYLAIIQELYGKS